MHMDLLYLSNLIYISKLSLSLLSFIYLDTATHCGNVTQEVICWKKG